MLNLGSIYLIVNNMEKSIAFYKALLDMPVSAQNENRWAQFNFGGTCIALFNPEYDEEKIRSGGNLENHYNQAYLEYKAAAEIRFGNNFVLNFWVEDLSVEYERVKKLNISKVSEILFINIAAPYYCFLLDDPDGNTIEITGKIS